VTLAPNAQLAGGATYTLTVSTAVKAVGGTPLTNAYTSSFTTAACPCSLFSSVTTPASVGLSTADGRTGAGPFTYEMGVKVKATQDMQVTSIRYYESPGETGTHVGRIWTSTGVLLASVTFTNESGSGWQQQALGSPVTMTANTVYVVSVNQNSFFVMTSGGLASSVTSGPLQSVADGANGVFGSSAGTFPSSTYASSNYFVDLVASPAPPPSPTVSSTAPSSGAIGADVLAPVTATFSRSMDPTTITGTTFTLTGPSGSVPATVTFDPTSNTAKLTPSAPLAFSSTYTARIDPGVKASDGTALGSAFSWSFTTAAGVPPQVTNVVPASGETDVNTGAVVKADFSKSLTPSTVNTSTFTLTGPSGSVSGTVGYNGGANEATFTPTASLAPGSYTARLAATITAVDGAQLGTAYSWTFTVPAAPVPLTVAASSPSGGASNVAWDTSVSATFSRAVTASTVSASSFTLTGPGGAVAGNVVYDPSSRTATLLPSSPLTAATTYTVQLTNAIDSDDGTTLATTSWTFTTGPCPCSVFSGSLTPTLTGNSTEDGRSGTGPFSYELGMKFVVTSPVQLTAIRFYKDAQETGTHVGTLWTADGTKVTSVTFTNESASGWQQQALPSGVTLQPGTTYVVSVNANAFFDVTPGGLATAQGAGPLQSVADGANGVFGTTAGVFPTGTYNSGNYFVDVVVK
jgi:hypothetical protein